MLTLNNTKLKPVDRYKYNSFLKAFSTSNAKNFSIEQETIPKSKPTQVLDTQRRLDFKSLDQSDINFFHSILPKESILTENLDGYNIDWSKKFRGKSQLVLKPKSTLDVSNILQYCNSKKIAVVPQSGNTGLVGGSVPVHDEIILSLSKLNRIISFNSLTNSLHCEAGCVLENLNVFLNEKGFQMPLDLGAKGSCLIGGNLATNAGGIHFVQHGSLRSNTKGLKFVLASGEIMDCLNPLPKNNTGLDLKQLLIGSEGILGVITECVIHTPEKPAFSDLALLAVKGYKNIVIVYKKVKKLFGKNLSAIEFFDQKAKDIQAQLGRVSHLQYKGSQDSFYLLVEISSEEPSNRKLLEEFLQRLLEDLDIEDAVIAGDETQTKKLWEIRETIREGASRDGLVISYDISLPVEKFEEIIQLIRDRVGKLAEVIGYGHIGDYNLHLNVCYNKHIKDEGYYKIIELLEPFVYDYLTSVGGSISAEHGVGILKAKYLDRSQTQENIWMMKQIKNALDPNGILNPYKLLI